MSSLLNVCNYQAFETLEIASGFVVPNLGAEVITNRSCYCPMLEPKKKDILSFLFA